MFLERVAALIASQKITRNKLLMDLNLDKSSFFNWERRGTIPSGDVVAKIADYFHVSTDYLLGRTDDPSPVGEEKEPTPDTGDGLSPEQADLVSLYESAPPALRTAALAVLRSAEGQDKPRDGASTTE